MSNSRLKEATDYLMERLDDIDEKYENLSKKSSMWRKAVSKVKRDLREEDKHGNLAISLNTYHDYLGDLRYAVKQSGRKHPALTSDLNRTGYISATIKALPDYEDDIKAIAKMPALTIHNGVSALKKKIKKDMKGTPRNDAVNALKSLLIHHPVVMMLDKEDAEKEDRAENREESLDAKTLKKKIYNGPALIEKALSLLYDESYTARAWALALLTGRRSAEIIYHAEFEYVNDRVVNFSGQLKKPAGTEPKPYLIPVLTDSKLIIDAMSKFRDMEEVSVFRHGTGSVDWKKDVRYADLDKRELNKAINQRTNGVLNARAKNITGDTAEVFKNTRVIYAEYCKHNARDWMPEWESMADDAYLKAILGHDQLAEVKHYNQCQVQSDASGEWLKVPEEKPEVDETEAEEAEEAQPVKMNWRATKGIKEMGETIEAYTERFIEMPARKVSIAKVHDLHFDQLRFWAAANPTSKITQTAVTKGKGNTWIRDGEEQTLSANRYTFQAWVQLVGADNVEAYNAGKEDA